MGNQWVLHSDFQNRGGLRRIEAEREPLVLLEESGGRTLTRELGLDVSAVDDDILKKDL
ncbi:uncharacterized protein J3R85_001741 [Psidium guajava]|nr:uncharacterized protein J3R85_001741 [Psidium guajava]